MSKVAKFCKNPGAAKRHGITVSVGYCWNKSTEGVRIGYEVLDDPYWESIKDEFSGICKAVEDKQGCRVDLRRLRATYGHPILESVLKHIRNSQALIFDLAAIQKGVKIPSKGRVSIKRVFDRLNYNVILELGAAEAFDIPYLVMCPKHLKELLPSDLSGYLVVFYAGEFVDGKLRRKCEDKRGFQSAFRGMLCDAIDFANVQDEN